MDVFEVRVGKGSEDAVELQGEVLGGGHERGEGCQGIQVGLVEGLKQVLVGEAVEVGKIGNHAGGRVDGA